MALDYSKMSVSRNCFSKTLQFMEKYIMLSYLLFQYMEGFMNEIMQSLAHGWHDLFTPAGFAMLVNVIMIDIVMSADNAILIGLATQKLAQKDKKKAIFFGIA